MRIYLRDKDERSERHNFLLLRHRRSPKRIDRHRLPERPTTRTVRDLFTRVDFTTTSTTRDARITYV